MKQAEQHSIWSLYVPEQKSKCLEGTERAWRQRNLLGPK